MMTTPRYVQHVSGQGEKWEVVHENDNEVAYLVKGKRLDVHPDLRHYLPKSEYQPCDPPEVWEDVTAQLEVTEDGSEASLPEESHWAVEALSSLGYRLRKVQNFWTDEHHGPRWAFIVERRK